MSAFARALRDLIALEGPITVERYMALCAGHYYSTRDPFGPDGDFTTAPEISQIFGELLGLWAATVWQSIGSPDPFRLVELGPGRGTLMADALRAGKVLPGFLAAARVDFVETSAALRERQRATLSAAPAPVRWHDRIEDVPAGPAIVIANEFFDALPVKQFVATPEGWRERLVGLEGDGLGFGLAAQVDAGLGRVMRPGEIREWPGAAFAVAQSLGHRLATEGGAALVIDYGSVGGGGDTLQAVKKHAFADPLIEPGEADLTVHVDFRRLAHAAAAAGARIHGPVTQGVFLEALGLRPRLAALTKSANPAQAAIIERGAERLVARGSTAMGDLFKVIGLSHPSCEALPGLPPASV